MLRIKKHQYHSQELKEPTVITASCGCLHKLNRMMIAIYVVAL